MFVELHMIQNFSPANLNRDDTNSPKDCEFGGVRRARISSQCIKRSIRKHPAFSTATQTPIGVRTKRLIHELREPLVKTGKPAEVVDKVLASLVPCCLVELDKKVPDRTNVLLYLARDEVQKMADEILAQWDTIGDKKAQDRLAEQFVAQRKGWTSAPDIALFGRMLAEKPILGLDAACQVAHAISTHRVTMEMDYYTAVDDLNPEDTAGAGMLGLTGFNSACFYRYSRIDWEQLVQNLKDDGDLARRTVEGFLRASLLAVPTGKQNAFAAQNPVSFAMAVVRDDGQSWSLANAFEKPVSSRQDSGWVRPSVAALDTYWDRLSAVYGMSGIKAVAAIALDSEPPLESLHEYLVGTLEEWVEAVMAALPAGEAGA